MLSCHDPILASKLRSLHKTQGDSVGRAEGYIWLSESPTGTKSRSPLALPFLSFTYPQTGTKDAAKHIVFMKEDTGYGRDLIAAVPVGTNVRKSPDGDPAQGWWHVNEIDGSSVEVEEW